MRILILGGTRFFGRETAIRLLQAGNEVTIFSRQAPCDGLPLDIRQARGDRTVEIDLARMAVEPWDAVIDNICFNAEDAQKAISVFSGRTGQYIFTSSASVYSVLEGSSSPFRESQTELLALKSPLKEKYAYAAGKYAAEAEFFKAFREKSFPLAVLRPPVVIGPNDPTLRAYSYWLRLADGGPLFLPGFAFTNRFIFSKDMARAMEKLVYSEAAPGRAYNVGDSRTMTLDDFVKISARIMHREARPLYPEYSWLKENGFNFDASPFSTGGDFVLDIARAEKELDWASTPAPVWIEESINWYLFSYTGPAPRNYAARKQELELARKWITKT
ncbi:MAG TPA: NAD-dependent epimerase/dehydratase family protein [Elusimicrobiales bacterium]|nr:NAD-dependent epimerase/dehydratase family protein [Elusimicrobiales bacterium]